MELEEFPQLMRHWRHLQAKKTDDAGGKKRDRDDNEKEGKSDLPPEVSRKGPKSTSEWSETFASSQARGLPKLNI